MNECIIVYRVNGGAATVVLDVAGELATFPHRDDALDYADRNSLFQSGQAEYQIVELDEI